ncbi:type I-C CRISPR-associated protein Cas8c/Csd1 [Trichloromonas sp.]|uniref:type I-C CRISPR-associated protein Cas8c/Csd1 n=1 Tax=Trichloromonas sp. TaxID=3069249 RepID=UPI003D814C06
MILQALNGYYRRMAEAVGADVAPEGFEQKEIPFLIVLNLQGDCVGIQDTREGEGKKRRGRLFTVPKGVKKTSGIAANFLWDTSNYVLGIPKPDPKKDPVQLEEKAREQQRCFIETIRGKFIEPIEDEGIQSVLTFLERNDLSPLSSFSSWEEISLNAPIVTFLLEGESGLVCQREAVRSVVSDAKTMGGEAAETHTCLVTGEHDSTVRLHTAIKGVWGAQSSGANIVSFNLDAFRSFGKEQGQNAPVGKRAEFAYTTALNKMLSKGSRQRLQVGDCSTVFWAERQSPLEDIFADVFSEPAKENPDQLNAAVRELFKAPESGTPPLDEDYTPFYVLGLAPNAARIAVRFWHPGTVGEAARHIKQHFLDCAIVHGPKQPEHLSLFRLLTATATQGKSENVPPNLAGDFMKAILAGTPYPHTLLASALRRCRAEQDVTYSRAALLKACLIRSNKKNSKKEVGMSLDITNTNPGYLLGRLFATLERAQESASPGINATIRDRFYGAASSTPVAVFPHLMKLKVHHIAKLENKGQAVNLERLIGEIVDKVAADHAFPAHLSLQDQGRFAVGYYHQRQHFFAKKEQ